MASPRRLVLAVVALLLGGGAALLWFRPAGPAASPPGASAASAPAPTTPRPPVSDGGQPSHSPLADELHDARFDAAHDLEVLRGLLAQFTTTLRLAERPPLGDNADIAAALTGRNRRRIVFVPALHPAIRDGLLTDRHGTPYHFHARSADAIDVRSAGPDRALFTTDDLVSPFPGASPQGERTSLSVGSTVR